MPYVVGKSERQMISKAQYAQICGSSFIVFHAANVGTLMTQAISSQMFLSTLASL